MSACCSNRGVQGGVGGVGKDLATLNGDIWVTSANSILAS